MGKDVGAGSEDGGARDKEGEVSVDAGKDAVDMAAEDAGETPVGGGVEVEGK